MNNSHRNGIAKTVLTIWTIFIILCLICVCGGTYHKLHEYYYHYYPAYTKLVITPEAFFTIDHQGNIYKYVEGNNVCLCYQELIDNCVTVRTDGEIIDIDKVVLSHTENDGSKKQMTKAEILEYFNGVCMTHSWGDSTRFDCIWNSEYTLHPDEYYLNGEYEGEIVVIDDDYLIPVNWTDYHDVKEKLRAEFTSAFGKKIVLFSVILSLFAVVLTVPIKLMAKKQKRMPLVVYSVFAVMLLASITVGIAFL